MSIKMKNQMKAIIKKDLRGITSNHRMFVTLLVVPLVLTIFVPTIFLLAIRWKCFPGSLAAISQRIWQACC